MNVLLVLLSYFYLSFAKEICDECICGPKQYGDEVMYVVNCTSNGFTSENVDKILETLPINAEVLLLRNNDLPSLPANLFGVKNFTKLKVIDLSNNKIQKIKGKTFHHVPSVKLLILDHNNISFDDSNHPRIFSNMENLTQLHLTDAFHDYESPRFADQLRDVFIDSNMVNLEKLHLEQNEIRNFSDWRVFCELKNLLDLHLGNNILTGLNFSIDCLPRLRFIDLNGNQIKNFSKAELTQLDNLSTRNNSFMIDIRGNPFPCNCTLSLLSWLLTTNVVVRDNSSIRCRLPNKDGEEILLEKFNLECNKTNYLSYESDSSTHRLANIIIFIILCILIALLSYISVRYSLDYFKHSGVSSGKVHYVVIKNFDESQNARV